MKNNRQLGLDFLRVFAMVIITSLHFVLYLHLKDSFALMSTFEKIFISVINSFSDCFVNIFVLISGYFLCVKEFSYKRIVSVWLQTFFACVATFIVSFIFWHDNLSLLIIVQTILPIISGNYWYIFVYFILLILSPILNKVIVSANEIIYRRYIILFGCILTILYGANPFIQDGIFIGTSQSIFWFIYIYLIGAYLRLHFEKPLFRYPRIILSVSFVFLFLIHYFGVKLPMACHLDRGTGILPLLLSVSLFVICQNGFLKSDLFSPLGGLSKSALFVYLIQESPLFRNSFWKLIDLHFVAKGANLFSTWIIVVIILFISAQILFNIYQLLDGRLQITNHITHRVTSAINHYNHW